MDVDVKNIRQYRTSYKNVSNAKFRYQKTSSEDTAEGQPLRRAVAK
jgi:hypothetical protein